MTARKRAPKPTHKPRANPIETDFDEEVARLLQTDPKELDDEIEKARQRERKIRENVEGRRKSIEKGPWRIAKKPPA